MKLVGVEDVLERGEQAVAGVKAMPRGSMDASILGAAGAVAGGAAGAAAADHVAGSAGEQGRAERAEAGVDVGAAQQVLLIVTDRRLVVCTRNWRGRPKEVVAALDRSAIADVAMGETRLFGQMMPEIVVTTTAGGEVGFGVAKVNRGDGERVVAALTT